MSDHHWSSPMAYIVPYDIPRLALSGAHEPEIETLGILKKSLSNDYTVFTVYTGRGNIMDGPILVKSISWF